MPSRITRRTRTRRFDELSLRKHKNNTTEKNESKLSRHYTHSCDTPARNAGVVGVGRCRAGRRCRRRCARCARGDVRHVMYLLAEIGVEARRLGERRTMRHDVRRRRRRRGVMVRQRELADERCVAGVLCDVRRRARRGQRLARRAGGRRRRRRCRDRRRRRLARQRRDTAGTRPNRLGRLALQLAARRLLQRATAAAGRRRRVARACVRSRVLRAVEHANNRKQEISRERDARKDRPGATTMPEPVLVIEARWPTGDADADDALLLDDSTFEPVDFSMN